MDLNNQHLKCEPTTLSPDHQHILLQVVLRLITSGLFWKNVLQEKEWNNSGDGVLSLVLNSFFASSGSVLKRVLIKNSSNGVLSKKRL